MENAEQIAEAGLELAGKDDVRSVCESLHGWCVSLTGAREVAVGFRSDAVDIEVGEVTAGSAAQRRFDLESGDGPLGAWSAEFVLVGPTRPEWVRIAPLLASQAALGIRRVIGLDRLNRHEDQQRALIEAGKALSSERTLDGVLRRIVEQAMALTGARYGALGVLDAKREQLASFNTVGIDDDLHRRIGDLPKGRGILGVLIDDPRPLRLRRLQDHPNSVGFPDHHPPMTSFLGVPILATDDVAGRIYLTEKDGATEFSAEDEDIVQTLASQAAIAIDNAGLNERLQQTAAQLEEASRHKSSFLANMSHELRSPLNTIIGYTRLLLEEPRQLDEEQLEDLRIVRDSGEHLLALITDLLDFQRIEAGRVTLDVAREDMRSIVEAVAASVRPSIPVGVQLVTDLGGLRRAEVWCDRTRIRQVLLNLVGNAAKFTERGSIVLSARDEGDWIVMEVQDTGPGIAEVDQQRIFESFFQSQAALGRTPHPREGAGLGLAITRLLTELHGGTVGLQSTPGIGTTVTVRLPRSPASGEGTAR